jgi:F-type H+-transporting ATPase subunit epsilon
VLTLRILTPERQVLETQASAVYATATDGELGILSGHIPLLASLKPCVLRYTTPEGNKERVAVMGGMLETDGQQVTVLTTAAELANEIDELRAKEAKTRAEARLNERHDKVDIDRAQMALARSVARLKLHELIRTNLVK